MIDSAKLKIQVRDLVEEVYEDLKQESDNYRELQYRCKRYCKELGSQNDKLGQYMKEIFDKKMEHELRNVKIEKKSGAQAHAPHEN